MKFFLNPNSNLKIFFTYTLALTLALAFTSPAFSKTQDRAKLPAQSLTCEDASKIELHMLNAHVRPPKNFKTAVPKLADTIMHNLDPSRTYFTQQDKDIITNFLESDETNVCKIFHQVYQFFLEKVTLTQIHIESSLADENFKVDPATQVNINYRSRTFSKDEAHRLERLEARLQWRVQEEFKWIHHFSKDKDFSSDFDLAKQKVLQSYQLYRSSLSLRLQFEKEMSLLYLNTFGAFLDPHSFLIEQGHMSALGRTGFSLPTFGASLTPHNGYLLIGYVAPWGNAKAAGLQPWDRVVSIYDQDSKEWLSVYKQDFRGAAAALEMLESKLKTGLSLRLVRDVKGREHFMEIHVDNKVSKLSPSSLPLATLDYVHVKNSKGDKVKVGVIELIAFSPDSYHDLVSLIRIAKAQNVSALVLDLSNNAGGYVGPAVAIAGLFLNKPVVLKTSTRSKLSFYKHDPQSGEAFMMYDGPLVVLASPISGSSAEIVMGALKDYKRAVIVGPEITYGKGTLQKSVQVNLPEPSSIEALFNRDPKELTFQGILYTTTSFTHRPNGDPIQGKGIRSDIHIPSDPYQILNRHQLAEGLMKNSMSPPKSIKPFQVEGAWKAELQLSEDVLARLSAASKKRLSQQRYFQELAALEDRIFKGRPLSTKVLKEELLKPKVWSLDQLKKGKHIQSVPQLQPGMRLQEAVNIAADLWSELYKSN